ncbi:hypothetical protein K0M31_011374 [Melipona bicolor]|uniref:Uncharacterized protein n=1 Tax=Melipona bicolor TaxID=60889 RepID=A0AA40G9F1_9HYME|nr:hypothetical protein K0M31_011374 [Melipona bicolor]
MPRKDSLRRIERRSKFVLANVTENATVAGQWSAERVLPVYTRPRYATYSLLVPSVTILSPVVNNAPHPAAVRDGPWMRSKTMKQPGSLGPETKFRDGRVAKYRANRDRNRRPTRTSPKLERVVDLWIVDEMESDLNEEEGDTVSRVFSMFRSVTVN